MYKSMIALFNTYLSLLLILPFQIGRNRIRSIRVGDFWKYTVLLGFAGGVVWAEYVFFDRFWALVGSVPLGYTLLVPRFFSIMGSFLLAFLSYSSFLSALSSLYRSEDLSFLFSLPVRVPLILFTKWLDVAVRSGSTLILLSLPPMISLGFTLHLSSHFYLGYMLTTMAFASLGVSLGVGVAMIMVAFFPVKRMHQTAAILGLCLAVFVITGLRYLHIETLWSEQALENPVILFLQQESSIFGQFAPGKLFSLAVMPLLSPDQSKVWFWGNGILAIFATVGLCVFGKRLYLKGWWKSQEQSDPEVRSSALMASRSLSTRSSSPFWTLYWKEWLIFKRDPSIWTQLFMMIPLAVLYLLNLSFLPLKMNELVPFYAAADVGLIGLIIAAIGARFLFPSASREGKAIWIPSVSPVSAPTIIVQKVLFSVPPVLLLAGFMLWGSVLILHLSFDWMLWSLLYGMVLSVFICFLAVFLGFWFPTYSYRHVMEVSLGQGAFLFMVIALMQIISLEYGMIRTIFLSPSDSFRVTNRWLIGWILIWSGLIWICYRGGIRRWYFSQDRKNSGSSV